MTTESNHERALTRRTFAGLGLAAGAAAVAGFPEVPALAGPPSRTPIAAARPEAFGSINPALTYVQIDALAFFTYDTGESRFFTDATGVQSANSGHYLAAPIPIPCGSTIYEALLCRNAWPKCR